MRCLVIIKALANEARINILELLDDGCLNVNEIAGEARYASIYNSFEY